MKIGHNQSSEVFNDDHFRQKFSLATFARLLETIETFKGLSFLEPCGFNLDALDDAMRDKENFTKRTYEHGIIITSNTILTSYLRLAFKGGYLDYIKTKQKDREIDKMLFNIAFDRIILDDAILLSEKGLQFMSFYDLYKSYPEKNPDFQESFDEYYPEIFMRRMSEQSYYIKKQD